MMEVIMYESISGERYSCMLTAMQDDFMTLRDDLAKIVSTIPIPRGNVLTARIAGERIHEVEERVANLMSCLLRLGCVLGSAEQEELPDWAKGREGKDE